MADCKVPDLIQFTPEPGVPDGLVIKLLLAHDAYLRARELRERATLLLALLGLPLALALSASAFWPRWLTPLALVAFGSALVLTIGAAFDEWACHLRRARLVARVEPPPGPPVP